MVDSGPVEVAEVADAADAPAAGAKAVEAGDLLKFASDLTQGCAAETFGAAVEAEPVARVLEFGEEPADLVGLFFGGAKIEGALAPVLAIDEAVVGSEAASVAGAVGGDDGADAGEEGGVLADEVEGWFGHGGDGVGRAYLYVSISIQKYTYLSIGKLNSGRDFLGGGGGAAGNLVRGQSSKARKPRRRPRRLTRAESATEAVKIRLERQQ